jgi:hypothetical protein
LVSSFGRFEEVVMGMKFYELHFKLISPANITFKKTEKGFLSALKYIPASMLRGALISSLYWKGALDEELLKREATEPRIIASPAYPIDDGKRAYPCHPFAYECKIPHEDAPEGKERINYVDEVLQDFIARNPPKYKVLCSKGHMAISPLHPNPVIPIQNRLREVKVRSYRTVSVGMNKHKGSHQRGMLFEYESISSGQEFWSALCVPDEVNLEIGMKFAVGRGVSRGFGRAELTMLKEISLDEKAESVKNAIENKATLVLYSISQMISIDGEKYYTYPHVIELEKIAKRIGMSVKGVLRIGAAYGRTRELISGWDMARNMERPIFSLSGNNGSILVAKVEGEGEVTKVISALEFLGTVEVAGGVPVTGVNMLSPLREHPMGGR